jgi:RimJ/RimL family protein N-acetyltransferase
MIMTARPTLDDLGWPVLTERLTLRRARPADADIVFTYRRLEPVGRWLTRIQTDREEWEREWHARGPTTIVVERDGTLIGDTRIVPEDAHSQAEVESRARGVQAELMWAFDPAHQGNGYGTEAVRALIEIAFRDLRMRRLVAFCYTANEPSWRLMERVGMRRESVMIAGTLHRDGSWHDFFGYALLANEGQRQRRRDLE